MSTTTTAITITAVDSAGLDELVNELNENDENQYEKPAAAPSLCARVCVCVRASVCLCCVHTFGIITYAVCYTHMHRHINMHMHVYFCMYLTVSSRLCECLWKKIVKISTEQRGKQVEKKA